LTRARAVIVLLVSALATFALPAAGQSVVAGPTSTQFLAAVGDRVTIPVAVDMTNSGGKLLGAYRMRVKWNPAVLTYVSSQGGAFGTSIANTDSTAQGILKVAGANASGAAGVIVLGSATLQVASLSAADTLRVTFQELTAAQTFQDLLPILSTTSGQFCGGGAFGDLNADGLIQSLDAQIVATHAVGLAVSDTTHGDVDNDGKVNSRDALIILSKVVGLDVSAFRIGSLLIGACTPGIPASVAIVPGNLTLAPSDNFHASANVLSAGGAILTATSLVWTSSNGSVATVDPTGAVHAVFDGTTTLTATVAPGVSGTATVTVGPRHRWVVNPAVGVDKDKAVGSDQFPFSTIADAIDKAQNFDTVAIGVATYNESLTSNKGLVYLGDSTAAGMPTLLIPGKAAGIFLNNAPRVVRRLNVTAADSGFSFNGGDVDMSSVTFTSLRGSAITTLFGRVTLRGVTVSGAVGIALNILIPDDVFISQSHVAGIAADSTGFALGIQLFVTDTAVVDSSSVQGVAGPGIEILTTNYAEARGLQVSDVQDEAYGAFNVKSIVADNVSIARAGSGFIVAADTLRLSHATMLDIAGAAVEADPLGPSMRTDVSDLTADRVQFGFFGSGQVTTLKRVSFSHVASVGLSLAADTLTADTVSVNGVQDGPGFEIFGSQVAALRGLRITNVAGGGIVSVAALGYVSLMNSFVGTITGGNDGIHVHADSVLLVNDTVRNVTGGSGVVQDSSAGANLWLRIRGGLYSNIQNEAIRTDRTPLVEIVGAEVDSSLRSVGFFSPFSHAVFVYKADSVRADSTNVHDNIGGGIFVDSARVVTLEGGAVRRSGFLISIPCEGDCFAVGAAVQVHRVLHAAVRHMDLRDNVVGVFTRSDEAGDTLVVEGNTLHGPFALVNEGSGIPVGRIEARNNSFAGTTESAVSLDRVSAVIVESNTFDSVAVAVDVSTADTIRVQGNTMTRILHRGVQVNGSPVMQLLDNNITCADLPGITEGLEGFGTLVVTGNSVFKCTSGGSFGGSGLGDTVVVRDNVVDRAGATNAPQNGLHLTSSVDSITVVHNTITNNGGIDVVGFGAIPFIRVDSNTVTGAAGRGIAFDGVGGIVARGNTVSGTTATLDFAAAGISILSASDSARVVANSVTGNALEGIRVGSAINVRVDTNLVTDNGGAGIVLAVPVTGQFNTVRRNTIFGIVDSAISGIADFSFNNIDHNGIGIADFVPSTILSAPNNWWGDASGPACTLGRVATAGGCVDGSVGDSIGPGVLVSPVATAPIGGAPAGAPRFASFRPSATAVPAAPARRVAAQWTAEAHARAKATHPRFVARGPVSVHPVLEHAPVKRPAVPPRRLPKLPNGMAVPTIKARGGS
jgi:hypothetical protein